MDIKMYLTLIQCVIYLPISFMCLIILNLLVRKVKDYDFTHRSCTCYII